MDQVTMVEQIYCFGHLINDVLLMPLLKISSTTILPDESVQVDIHMLEHQVNVPIVTSRNHSLQLDDIWMSQLAQEHDFTVGTLGIS